MGPEGRRGPDGQEGVADGSGESRESGGASDPVRDLGDRPPRCRRPTPGRRGDLNPVLRSFADGRLFGSVTGTEAPRVLALHGWARSHRDFDAVLARAGEAPLPALALDLPGFGASPPPPAAWGAAAYAEAGRAGPRRDGSPGRRARPLLRRPGGPASRRPASRRRSRPWCSPACRCCTRSVGAARVAPAYRVIRRLHRMRLVSDAAMEAARQRYGSADYQAAQGIMRQVLVRSVNETYEEQLDAVRCPVHLVWGADDTAAPLEVAERAVARLAHGDLAVHPGRGAPDAAPHSRRAARRRGRHACR